MNSLKIDALFLEFKFLDEHLERSKIFDFKVQRMDVALLDTTIRTRVRQTGYYDFSNEPEYNCMILDKNGKRLLKVCSFEAPPGMTQIVYQAVEVNVKKAWYKPWTWPILPGGKYRKHSRVKVPVTEIFKSESVKNALYRLGARMDEASFVVIWRNEESVGTLLIYKAPRGRKISEWINEEIENLRVHIHEECQAL